MKWAIGSIAGVLVMLAATGLYGGSTMSATPAREYHVWAWRRDEDLSFVDPRRVRVAVRAATIRLDGRAIMVERRNKTIVYPRDARRVGTGHRRRLWEVWIRKRFDNFDCIDTHANDPR